MLHTQRGKRKKGEPSCQIKVLAVSIKNHKKQKKFFFKKGQESCDFFARKEKKNKSERRNIEFQGYPLLIRSNDCEKGSSMLEFCQN